MLDSIETFDKKILDIKYMLLDLIFQSAVQTSGPINIQFLEIRKKIEKF